MFEVILENSDGDQINFATDPAYTIISMEGLNPPEAIINTSSLALIDGARYNSAKLDMRTVLIAFAIEYDAPVKRVAMYKVLRAKQYVKLYYHGDVRNVFIEGYIEALNIDYFDMKQIATVTILCPDPWLKDSDLAITDMALVNKVFHFPFASTASKEIIFGTIITDVGTFVDNVSDSECGIIIELFAKAAVSDPTIYNYDTGDFIGLSYDMQASDIITIDTRQGKKSATLLRSGVTYNLFNYVIENSTWLQLPANGATYVYTVGSGSYTYDLVVSVKHYNIYEGV